MLNYKFWLFVMWVVIGIVNLASAKISKLAYGCTWLWLFGHCVIGCSPWGCGNV